MTCCLVWHAAETNQFSLKNWNQGKNTGIRKQKK